MTCGYAPKRHPHTSRIARSYLVFSNLALPASLVQHFPHPSARTPRSNCFRSSQEEQRRFAALNPSCKQDAESSSVPRTVPAESSRANSSPEIKFRIILKIHLKRTD